MKIVCPFQVSSKLDNLDNFNDDFTQRSNVVLFKLFGLWNPFPNKYFMEPHP
jgi:hypothetical protein